MLMRGNVSTISRDLNASQVGFFFLNADCELILAPERRNNEIARIDYLGANHPRRIRLQRYVLSRQSNLVDVYPSCRACSQRVCA